MNRDIFFDFNLKSQINSALAITFIVLLAMIPILIYFNSKAEDLSQNWNTISVSMNDKN